MNNIEMILQQLKKTDCDKNELLRQLQSNMTAEQSAKVNSVLNDKALMSKLMSSPEAQDLLKKFGGGSNGY